MFIYVKQSISIIYNIKCKQLYSRKIYVSFNYLSFPLEKNYLKVLLFWVALNLSSRPFQYLRAFELGTKNEISWKNLCISNQAQVVSVFTIGSNQWFHHFFAAETIKKNCQPPISTRNPFSDLSPLSS